ncbi:MAG: hypothetical protein ACI808_002312 [Paraglaciecola sp.]|jgi:hypothetical protein
MIQTDWSEYMKKYLLLTTCLLNAMLLTFNAVAQEKLEVAFKTSADIYMVGDVHGAYKELVSILRHASLVDEQLNWVGGPAHFVSTGDLMDRGPSSRKIMDLLMKLQVQALQAGGKVHVLLGNHEVLNLTGDWRYISKAEYLEFAGKETPQLRNKYFQRYVANQINSEASKVLADFNNAFPDGFFARLEAFMPNGIYGSWLHTLPLLIKINQHVFTHGGLSVKTQGMKLDELNRQLKNELASYTSGWSNLIKSRQLMATTDFSQRTGIVKSLPQSDITERFLASEHGLIFSLNSPNWYRGNAWCHPLFESQLLEESLSQWQAKTLWVGHTTAQTVRQRFDKKIQFMDTGMLKSAYGGHPIYAKIFAGSQEKPSEKWQFVNAASGEFVEPESLPVRSSPNPYNKTDAELESFFKTAEVIEKHQLGTGITDPLKITLQQGNVKIHAIFKHLDTGNGRQVRTINNSDRFQYEVVAYKLDRLMNLHLVPVAVERQINGKKGTLQLWIDDLISVNQMRTQKIRYDGFCDYKKQRQMMNVFDYLIHNEDRHLGNITFSLDDWQIWLIDHSRSFRTLSGRPKLIRKADLSLTPEFRQALEAINKEALSILRPWLSTKQINALIKRRNKLLAGKA